MNNVYKELVMILIKKKRVRDFSKNIKDRNIKTTNKFKKLYNNVKRLQRRSNMIFRYAYGKVKE